MATPMTDQQRATSMFHECAKMREQIASLELLLSAQVDFTERLRNAANAAIAHASHIHQNYAQNVPSDALSKWAEAQVVFNVLSITPSPAQAVATVVRDGAAVN